MHSARVIPYLHVDAVDAALEFYRHVFGAREWMRLGVVVCDEGSGGGLPGRNAPAGGPAVTLGVAVHDFHGILERALPPGHLVAPPGG